jgi:nicotinamide riboside transporter PnuC
MLLDPNGVLVQGFILCTGIVGQLFVAQMNHVGFYFWLARNMVLVAVSLHFGSYGMVGLYTFFGVMSLYSIYKWKKLQASKTPT